MALKRLDKTCLDSELHIRKSDRNYIVKEVNRRFEDGDFSD